MLRLKCPAEGKKYSFRTTFLLYYSWGSQKLACHSRALGLIPGDSCEIHGKKKLSP
jgi:hypothetical protein